MKKLLSYTIHGRRKGGQGGLGLPWILKVLTKKVFFSISRGKHQLSPFLAPPWKKFWENPILAHPGKNPSDGHDYILAKFKWL